MSQIRLYRRGSLNKAKHLPRSFREARSEDEKWVNVPLTPKGTNPLGKANTASEGEGLLEDASHYPVEHT